MNSTYELTKVSYKHSLGHQVPAEAHSPPMEMHVARQSFVTWQCASRRSNNLLAASMTMPRPTFQIAACPTSTLDALPSLLSCHKMTSPSRVIFFPYLRLKLWQAKLKLRNPNTAIRGWNIFGATKWRSHKKLVQTPKSKPIFMIFWILGMELTFRESTCHCWELCQVQHFASRFNQKKAQNMAFSRALGLWAQQFDNQNNKHGRQQTLFLVYSGGLCL